VSRSKRLEKDALGRFLPGNQVARRAGLRSTSRRELRRRSPRVGRWTKRLQIAFADAGRPLTALSLPMATKWAELETMRVDLYAAFAADPKNAKMHEQYLATCRLQVQVEHALGMTPSLAASMRSDDSMDFLKSIASKRRGLPDGAST
jgi:hypothetical protein